MLNQFKDLMKTEGPKADRKLRLGIIGTGWIASVYAEAFVYFDDITVTAIADLVPGKAEAFKEKYGFSDAVCYPSHKELVDNNPDLDAVFVCTYNRAHAECTIYALDAGINVLCEKPMCVTLDEAEIGRAHV